MADADFAGAVAIGEVGNRIYLIGGGIAGRFAFRLERQGDDGVAGHAVARDRVAVPGVERNRLLFRLLLLQRPDAAGRERGLGRQP